jgi:hypothetical protein
MAAASDDWEPSSTTLSYAYAAVLRDDVSIGTAFLVDRNLALTCAHVAYYAATGRRDWKGAVKPAGFQLRFPQCQGRPIVRVEIAEWFPAADDDFALLRIVEGEATGAMVVSVSADARKGDKVRLLGFPKGVWYGVPLEGEITEPGGRLTAAIDEASLIGVAQGFSGAPVWSDRVSGVVGMVSTAAQDQPRFAAAVPMSVILPRLQSVSLNAGIRSRVRMAFEAPRNRERCHRIQTDLEAFADTVSWPTGWRPDLFDVVEEAMEGDLEIPWTSCWSTAHPLNKQFPKDGDLFFTISLRPTGRTTPRNLCEIARVWSGRGVSFRFSHAVSQAEARSYLQEELQAHLNKHARGGYVIQPSDWYGIELAGHEPLPGEPDGAFAGRVLERMVEMAELFQAFIYGVESDLQISLAKRVRRRRTTAPSPAKPAARRPRRSASTASTI